MIINNLIKCIIKQSRNIRHKFIITIIKYFVPSLYRNLNIDWYTKQLIIKKTNRPIRPFIFFIKEKFNNKLLIGAEIGVYKGKNAKDIIKMLNMERLYLIDIWKNYKKMILLDQI